MEAAGADDHINGTVSQQTDFAIGRRYEGAADPDDVIDPEFECRR